jgi:hypothetical protein
MVTGIPIVCRASRTTQSYLGKSQSYTGLHKRETSVTSKTFNQRIDDADSHEGEKAHSASTFSFADRMRRITEVDALKESCRRQASIAMSMTKRVNKFTRSICEILIVVMNLFR